MTSARTENKNCAKPNPNLEINNNLAYHPVHDILDHSFSTVSQGSQWIPLPPPGRDAGVKSAMLLATCEHYEITAFNTW